MAVDRVSTIINEKSPAIKFKLLENLMNISSVDSESGLATEDVITEYLGNQMEVGFNSKYILEMINNLEDDKITLSFNDTSSPVIATEQSNPDLIYVLMPMRVWFFLNFFQNIKLENYRNFNYFEIDFTSGCNILIGKNGSGKTNILESISLFEKGRGFRK